MRRMVTVLAVAVLAVGCAEATSTGEPPRGGQRISPVAGGEIDAAQRVLQTLPEFTGWERGVVLEENTKGGDWWRVLTDFGVAVLEPCASGDAYEYVGRLVAPGDGIAWSSRGDDRRVCENEIRVTRAAATERAPR